VFVALLRGINVGGNRKLPMAELRDLATRLGFTGARTHVQSGNLVFGASGKAAELESALETAIEAQFGFAVPIVVRTAAAFATYAPPPAFAAVLPNLLHLALAKGPVRGAAVKELEPYCRSGERVQVVGDAIWIDFAGGVAGSKLTSPVLDRVFGSTVTARNWKSVQAITALSNG
jgi:uncharacterized protein (DUF1697 family)